MAVLDLRNRPCPEPVVETKRAIETNPSSVLEILLNHPASVTNVTRMATSLGATVEKEELGEGEVRLVVTTGHPRPQTETTPRPGEAQVGRATVFIKNDYMGLGNEELGRVLMKAFLKTLKNATPLPREIIFINHGVLLTTTGSEEIETLRELVEAGVEIVACGTCLDYFAKLDKVEVGTVGNMFEIVERLNRAVKIIAP